MFLLNSCLGQFSAASLEALLLPKLRSHFAEFLNNASPVGLRILSSSTCVGLRYGYPANNSGFSRQSAHVLPYLFSVRVTSSDCVPDLLIHSYLACTGLSIPGSRSLPASPQFCYRIVQEFQPVVHRLRPFDLALGPDLPRADQLYPGNLRYSAEGFPPSSRYSFRHSLFLTVHGSFRYRFVQLTMLLYRFTFVNP